MLAFGAVLPKIRKKVNEDLAAPGLPQRKVETYKNTHPNWKEMDLHQIGRALGADYVTTFTVAPSTARVLALPDFARGPGQAVVIPAATGTGWVRWFSRSLGRNSNTRPFWSPWSAADAPQSE